MRWAVVEPKEGDGFTIPAELEWQGLTACRYGYLADDGERYICVLGVAREDVVDRLDNARVVAVFDSYDDAVEYMERLWGGR